MSNENPESPVFSVQKIYTKDISFESPNAPQVFFANDKQPKIELNLGVENRQIDENHWEVVLKVSILAMHEASNNVLFEIEVEQAGLFLMQDIPEEHMPVVLAVDCPTIIFPYTRQVISQLAVDGGFIPMLLDPFNFSAAYQNMQEKGSTTH